MPGWFDIVSSCLPLPQCLSGTRPIVPIELTHNAQKAFGGDLKSKEEGADEPGVLSTSDYVHSLIQGEIDSGIPSDRIVVGGYVALGKA